MKDRVEEKMIAKFPMNVFARADLMVVLLQVLNDLKTETELFETLLRSFPRRLEVVRNAEGGHTGF